MIIPNGLEWWRGVDGGPEWLSSLPRLIHSCCEKWSLTFEAPFEPASVAYVAAVTTHDGARAVLKINFPDDESKHEPNALIHWGDVRVLARDDSMRAFVVERVVPGRKLSDVDDEDEMLDIAATVLARQWAKGPSSHFRSIHDDCARWARDADELPLERELVDAYRAACIDLPHTTRSEDVVVCHQDFHGGNVLLSGERWISIDPKPLLADKAFDLASLIRDRRATITRDVVVHRLDTLSARLGVDRDRVRRWALVHALAWSRVDGDDTKLHEDHVAVARWLASA